MTAHIAGLPVEELWLAVLAGGGWSAWLAVVPRRARRGSRRRPSTRARRMDRRERR